MKKSIQLLSLSVIMISTIFFIGCDKKTVSSDVTFPATYNANLDKQVPANTGKTGAASYSISDTIDPLSIPNMATYASQIQSINITDIKGIVGAGAPTADTVWFDTCSISISNADFANPPLTVSWHFTHESLTPGKEIALSNQSGEYNTLKQIFLAKNKFVVKMEAVASYDNVFIPFSVVINNTVVASVTSED